MDEIKENTQPVTESVVVESKETAKIILDGKEVTAEQLAEAQSKNPRRVIFDENTKEYRTLQVLRG